MTEYLAKMEEQGFEEMVFVHDSESGLKAAIAIHNTNRGPALGGTRMWVYPNEEAAIDDVMHLARAMSYKAAAADLPLGGGKGVIIGDPDCDKCEPLFRAYGRKVEHFNGRFITAADMGIYEDDLDQMRLETDHILGGKALGSPSPFTAYGVWRGMKACAEEIYGSPDLKGLTVAVQGAGSVGASICRHLVEEGAKLIITDVDDKRVIEVAEECNAKAVGPDEIYSQECDIFSPCACGFVINDETLPLLKCRIVAGCANNILKDDKKHSAGLHERGILYAPDYVINAGGLIFVWMRKQGIDDENKIKAEIFRIEERLKELFRRSREQQILPQDMADRMAEEKMQEKLNVNRFKK